jgi:hypothetical protein
MRHDTHHSRTSGRLGLAAAVALLSLSGVALADNPPTLAEAKRTREATASAAPAPMPEAQRSDEASLALAEQWGVEVASIRLTAHGHMIDYRYRVLDPEKANALFARQIKPQLIHQETGKVLAVPDTAKVGPLRNSNTPQDGKVYWMFFGNGQHLVQKGDRVTVVIGDFRVEDLVVE